MHVFPTTGYSADHAFPLLQGNLILLLKRTCLDCQACTGCLSSVSVSLVFAFSIKDVLHFLHSTGNPSLKGNTWFSRGASLGGHAAFEIHCRY